MDRLSASVPGALSPTEQVDVSDLLARARAGDGDAMGRLLESQRERLQRIVRIRLGSGLRRFLATSDVIQETHRSALESLQRLDIASEGDLIAWLAQVATNRIRDQHDHYSARKRDAARDVPWPDEGPDTLDEALAARGPSPSVEAAHLELASLVDDCLAELPTEYREVIVLRDYCGASWEHITAELGGRSLHAAQQLHQRAWIKLRKLVLPRL